MTPDGTIIPKFTVMVRPLLDKPQLLKRKHFTNGEFTIDGLNQQRYQIQVSAADYITSRMDLDFTNATKAMEHAIVILQTFRNEARFQPGKKHVISLKELRRKIPERAREAYRKAVELHRQGRLDEALVEYGSALRAYPHYLEALADLSTIFILYNRPDSALTFLRRAQQIDNRDPIINMNIAIALSEKRDYSAAVKLLKKVIDTDPHIAQASFYIAKIRYSQGKYEEAEAALRRTLELDPKVLDAWLLLAQIGFRRNDNDQTREALMRLREATGGRISKFIDEQVAMLGS